MQETLKMFKYVDGVNDTPFPDKDGQVCITEYTYTAQRMGSAPSISTTVNHFTCLDNLWSSDVYVEFRGEKYYVRSTPSSSKDNSDQRYKHEVRLQSEREKLNHVYFIDAVQQDADVDIYKSNDTNVIFMGDIHEMAERFNAALAYAGMDYNVVVDLGITTDPVLVQFTDKYIGQALQDAYNAYGIPYYFVGKVIHFGYNDTAIPTVFRYGHNDALLSVNKQNANYQVINRITGVGSSDNIPLYYPNMTHLGDVEVYAPSSNTGVRASDFTITNAELFATKIEEGKDLEYVIELYDIDTSGNYRIGNDGDLSSFTSSTVFSQGRYYDDDNKPWQFFLTGEIESGDTLKLHLDTRNSVSWTGYTDIAYLKLSQILVNIYNSSLSNKLNFRVYNEIGTEGDIEIYGLSAGHEANLIFELQFPDGCWAQFKFIMGANNSTGWHYDDDNLGTDLSGIGLEKSTDTTPADGDKISLRVKENSFIPVMKNLMPPIYRESYGASRFYNAKNERYKNEDDEYYVFENEYDPSNILEGKTSFDDIKPSIKGMTNASGQPIDEILDVAFDTNDNDEIDDEGNYLHPYFFVKLRKFDGNYGFNLFDHAIESQAMQISLTSGACGACTFEIAVSKETQKNTVQVDSDGDLMRDDEGNVLCQNQPPQDKQNNTFQNEVWIALRKEDSTYGQIMPNKQSNLRPKAGDTFVILAIDLPHAYMESAEKRLEDALIKFMWENNVEKYNFNIKFSRIYFEEREDVARVLNENSRITVEYNGIQHTLYVNSYTYKTDGSSPLPEIEVSLTDTLSVGQNSLQNTISSVTKDLLLGSGGADFLKQGLTYFLRKDIQDETKYLIRFLGGIITNSLQSANYASGLLGSGFSIRTDSNGKSYLEVDDLLVRMKAVFHELGVMKTELMGASFLFNPTGAWIEIERVEQLSIAGGDDVYRCYFKNDDGEQAITNRFRIGNMARSQSFNIRDGVYENVSNHYYWRYVSGVGDNYIDLSVTDCDTGSDIPQAGDIVIQIGDKDNTDYQSAIMLSAVGDYAPSLIFYNGINDYVLTDKDILTIGYDKDKKECFVINYGRFYSGDKDRTSYVEYTKEKGLEVKGVLQVRGGSSGATNFTDLPDAVSDAIDVGGENMLRNAGFTGDFKFVNLSQDMELDSKLQMYNQILAYWSGTGNVHDDDTALSGKSCDIGSLAQPVATILDESYVIAVKAKGVSLAISCGNFSTTETLSDEYTEYVYKIKASANRVDFTISGNGTICDLKMERGTVRTDWTPSSKDDPAIVDRFKHLWDIMDAMQGSTMTIGGLMLSSMLMLGTWENGYLKKINGGMSGVCSVGDEVAFWAGGDYEEACATMRRFRSGIEITDDEWKNLAKFVVSHSGDVFMRGYIHALGGIFRGTVYAENGVFDGMVKSRFISKSVTQGGFIIDPFKHGTNFEGQTYAAITNVEDTKKEILYLPKVTNDIYGVVINGISLKYRIKGLMGLIFGVQDGVGNYIYDGEDLWKYCRISSNGEAHLACVSQVNVVDGELQDSNAGIWYAYGRELEFSNDLQNWFIPTVTDDGIGIIDVNGHITPYSRVEIDGNYSAIGVVVRGRNSHFVISLNEDESPTHFYNSTIQGVTATSSESVARNDFNGVNNSQGLGIPENPSSNYFPDEREAYIGGIGEYQSIIFNLPKINELLLKCGGTPISEDKIYMSSTMCLIEDGFNELWTWKANNEVMDSSSDTSVTYYYRPLAFLPEAGVKYD